MGSYVVREIEDGERRAVRALLYRSLHRPSPTDEQWALIGPSLPAERRFAAFDGAEPVGMAGSFGAELAVPGGRLLPAAAVDGVAVRPDHTRRGVFTALMARQLADCAARGDAAAILHASETVIYGRIGYGIATRGKTLRIDTARALPRPELPDAGEVRLLDSGEAAEVVPLLYQRIAPNRPGMITRPQVWWPARHHRDVRPEGGHLVAVHRGPGGDDGYVTYQPSNRPERGHDGGVRVQDLHAADPVALAGLWRFLFDLEQATEIQAPMRPVDEPVDGMLTDPRACAVTGVDDHTWLRLVDVPAALAGRSYRGTGTVVLAVADRMLPANAGTYRISPDGAEPSPAAPQLRLDVEVLAMLYLGEWRPSTLAALGRIEVLDPAAVLTMDELFGTRTAPWCGTSF